MLKRVSLYASAVLLGLTCFSFVLLSSRGASAENAVVSDVLISIPVACTMTGTGMNSHNATINPGTYQADIGSTTLKVLCNDANGFAIYAIGYTGQTYGTTTLVGANSNQTIATGTGTSGTSQWAMKLNTNANATYAVSLDNGYGAYSLVPGSYTKVAHRDSATDIGTNATGAELSTTYAAFIASTQASDTYNGKVKYTMVHPSNDTPPVEVACANNMI
ncbi:hypothetical protein IJG89_04065 [Candidatus Saccharibacteria bacterium]|nr:hypothetical protein [Candidatus Saccharibacteria bacterium]